MDYQLLAVAFIVGGAVCFIGRSWWRALRGTGKGCGIHFQIADLNGDGRLDVIAPGKDGLCVYRNLGTAPDLGC